MRESHSDWGDDGSFCHQVFQDLARDADGLALRLGQESRRCDAGEAQACHRMGMAQEGGCGRVERDEAQARVTMLKACDLGSADGCVSYTSTTPESRFFVRNGDRDRAIRRAVELTTASCRAGDAARCATIEKWKREKKFGLGNADEPR